MAILFDGDDYLNKDLGGTGPISATPMTMAAWIKPTANGTFKDWQDFTISDGTGSERFGFGAGNYGRWSIYWKNTQFRTSSSFSENYSKTSANPWSHAACVFSADDARVLYVNGSGNSHSNGSNLPQTESNCDVIGIGYGFTSGAYEYSQNTIAECALWNAALTTSEIDSLATGFSPLFIRPVSLLGYWPLWSNYIDSVGSNTLSATGDPEAAAHPRIFYPTSPQIGVPSGTVVPSAMHHYRMLRCS